MLASGEKEKERRSSVPKGALGLCLKLLTIQDPHKSHWSI